MWVKIDDSFPDHPKVAALSDAAFRLHISGLCYAGRYLTDGFVPETFTRESTLTKELTKSGVWDKSDAGWVIHDYLEYNPSRALVLEERERIRQQRSEAGKARASSAQRVAGRFAGDSPPAGNQRVAGSASPAGAPAGNQRARSVRSPAPSRPSPREDQVQELPPTAGESGSENSWMQTPNGWSDSEAALVRKLLEHDETWKALTPGAVNKLNQEYGRPVVTTALQRMWEEKAHPRNGAFQMLQAVCISVQSQEAMLG